MIDKLSMSESMLASLYNVFLLSSCEYTTFRMYECVSIIMRVHVIQACRRYRSDELTLYVDTCQVYVC